MEFTAHHREKCIRFVSFQLSHYVVEEKETLLEEAHVESGEKWLHSFPIDDRLRLDIIYYTAEDSVRGKEELVAKLTYDDKYLIYSPIANFEGNRVEVKESGLRVWKNKLGILQKIEVCRECKDSLAPFVGGTDGLCERCFLK